jgi:hypothetical protein
VIGRRHRVLGAVVLALAALTWAAWPPTPSGAAHAAAAARCRTGQLTVSLRFGPGSGSAGHLTGALLFRNRSSTRCSLRGHPGVSFVDARHRQIGVPADRAPGPVRTVTVAPGRSLGAQLTIVDVGVFDPAACRPTRAWGVRVFPPGRRRALFTRHGLMVCRSSLRDASVGPVVARSQLIPGTY